MVARRLKVDAAVHWVLDGYVNGTVQFRTMTFKSRLSPQREAEILTTAIELVGEVGFDRAGLDTVSARAGTSKSTLYRRWSSKSELVVEAVRQRIGTAFWFADQGSFRGDVLRALHVLTDWLERDAAILRTLAEAGHRDPLLRAEIDRQLAQPHNAMWEECVIDRARHRGELRPAVDVSWLNELCEAVLFTRLLLLDQPVGDAYLQRLTDEVVLPLLAVRNT